MYCWIEISESALLHNLNALRKLVGPSEVAPVLKSSAYGHDLSCVYRILAKDQCKWICTNYTWEARSLRELGFDGNILIVGPMSEAELEQAAVIKADTHIGSLPVLQQALKMAIKPRIHLKIDTGFGRQGIREEEVPEALNLLTKSDAALTGLAMHFANVEDVTKQEHAYSQLEKFSRVSKQISKAGYKPLLHAAASSSALLIPESRLNLSRIGISLYGLWPSELTKLSYLQSEGQKLELKPALSWKTKVTSTKIIKKGEYVGYGNTFKAPLDMKIAVLAVGYYEGYPRLAGSQSTYVLIRGERCQVIGRVCMNMLMVDINHLESCGPGDDATLIGVDGRESAPVEALAQASQTIHYEILSRLNDKIPRKIVP